MPSKKGEDKHKRLPGYKLSKIQHHILGWLPYLLSLAAFGSCTIVHRFKLPGFFYGYIVTAAYALYGMALSDYFKLGRHKYYVDGVRRPVLRGWSQTVLFIFVYPLLCWHMLVDPRVQDQFLAPRWVRILFLGGMGVSMSGTFLLHQMLYLQYWASLLVRWVDCLAINLQLATGLLCYGQCWRMWPIVALSAVLTGCSCVLLSLETRLRWRTPPVNDGVNIGSERANVEWYRLYITAGQGVLVCFLGPALDGFTPVSVCSSMTLLVGLLIYGFGNQYKVELPWNNIDLWHFHDDFHLLICATQVCTALIATRLA